MGNGCLHDNAAEQGTVKFLAGFGKDPDQFFGPFDNSGIIVSIPVLLQVLSQPDDFLFQFVSLGDKKKQNRCTPLPTGCEARDSALIIWRFAGSVP